MERSLPFLIWFVTYYVYTSHGCIMEGVTQWLAPQHESIMDTHRGLIINRSTSNIEGISRIDFGDGLNRGPYLELSLENSMFTVTTTNAFAEYEEYETLLSIRVTTTFSCTGGTFRLLTFVFNINDTNNHAPVFIPTDNYDFPLALPVPPGFNVTNCEYIIVRDVDLTTKAIEFGIDDNYYFNIIYSRQIQPKEFGGFINTKKLIRSTSENLTYQISATDIDETNDDPLTSYATINILADNEFRLPDEPIFSEAFYKADYTENHDLILREYISLRQGYDDQVIFDFEGEYADYFELDITNNKISFRVKSPLPSDISETQIFLVVKAQREFTSGATATVVIFMPEGVDVMFESSLYEGEIEDNILKAPNLILIQGYEEVQEIEIISEHASYFTANRQGNTITLAMSPLPTAVIQSNSVLNLQVVASANRSSAVCVVALEIIKDDYITPAFERTIYNGNYNPETGLSIEPIVLLQGYDNTVVIRLTGEHKSYFQIDQKDGIINLTASIPAELWPEGSLLLTIEAIKPRTVGASAAVLVNLPAARELMFEAPSYSGSIKNNALTLENIVLSVGYAEDVRFELSGTFASYFTTNATINVVTISLQTNLPDDVISENSALMLMLTASGLNTLDASTNILLNIIKNDYITPVFEHALYNGTYDSVTGLNLQDLVIIQGYDDTVEISLNGEHAESFIIMQEGQNIRLSGSIRPDIWPERYLLLTIHAKKPLTVGANAAIQIKLPEARQMNFEATKYVGYIMNDTINLEEIVLSIGYTTDVEFQIIGEYAQYFTVKNTENKVSINLNVPLPDNIIIENNFIVLTVSASGLNAVSASTIVLLEILKSDTTTPVFSQQIYTGIYRDSSNVEIENISLVQGFDNTVIFRLDGDHAQYFEIDNVDNDVKISLKSKIPEELIFTEKTLLFKIWAEKELTVGASAIVSIQFPQELTEPTIMRFSKNYYLGSLNNSTFEVIDNIVLDSGFRNGTRFILSGEYAEHFTITSVDNIVSISMLNSAPVEEMKKNNFIILQVEAHRERAVSVVSSLVVDIVSSDEIIFPVFEKPFYSGYYTIEDGLHFEQEIRLAAGFDNTVTFELEGDASQWFLLQERENSLTISRNESVEIPSNVIELNHQLLFSIVAHKPGTIGGRSAISIALPKDYTEQIILSFEENNYIGKIENGTVHLSPLSLNKDTATVEFRITGEYASYFSIVKNYNNITIKLTSNLNIDNVNTSFIVLTIEASHVEAVNGYTTVVLEITDINKSAVTPVFEHAYYIGDYTEESGLTFEHTIRLIKGFDDSVSFYLEGNDAQGFVLKHEIPNNVILSVNTEELPSVSDRSHLTFSIIASKPQSISGRTAIIISLKDVSTPRILRFTDDHYKGFIENGVLNLDVINLEEGYSDQVRFSLTGDYVDYFQFTNMDGNITLQLVSDLPSEITENYNILIFSLEAQIENTRTHTVIVLEIEPQETTNDRVLLFEKTYYTGSYSERNDFTFDSEITLLNGYDKQVQFILDGDHSIYFGIERRSENSVGLTLTSSIPPAVLANNRKLIFIIKATRPGSVTARATVVISLNDDYSQDSVLGFEQISYSGTIVNGAIKLEAVVLNEGFTPQVSFSLLGDFASLFSLSVDGPKVNIILRGDVPEDLIPPNRIILLELRASAPQALPAFATIVLTVEHENDIPPVEQLTFAETYYLGRYTEQDGLNFDQQFSLARGYDDSVVFALEGDNSIWFGLERRSENSVGLILTSSIPPAVLANNRKLIFVITATRPGSGTARATVVISLNDDYSQDSVLGFEQISYSGTIVNGAMNLEAIVLNEGFTPQVSFSLLGDLAFLFSLSVDGPKVNIILRGDVPEDLIPPNRIILLELRASAPQALPAFATIVLTVEHENDMPPVEQLTFAETYYLGRYTEQDGLNFDQQFSLARGYDDSVVFALEGDNSIWFGLQRRSENSVGLILTSSIPPAVLANNRKLIFIITATRLGSGTARATVVISLNDDYSQDSVLGFEQISYSGTIVNGAMNLEAIVLNEGFTPLVSFSLLGDLASLFSLSVDGPKVNIILRGDVPEDLIPPNRIILLELRASAPQALPAFATIVLTVEHENDMPPVEQLTFAETYYLGRYTEQDGLNFDQQFSLARGYDDSVVFALEGDNSIWFGLQRRSENSVGLILTSSIPPAVLANNRKLIFIITATRPGSGTARATVVISLNDDYSQDSVLGFEQISYSGTIVNGAMNLEAIVLNEGFTPLVSFSLLGDLASLFSLSVDGPKVNIILRGDVPEDLIPPNRIILLELRASAPQALPAFATIVLTVEHENDMPPVERLTFAETYYLGRYTEQDGLNFDQQFSLARGYDDSVVFALEGDNSIWFGLERRSENSVGLILTSSIPPAVLANNRKLIFVITATRPGSGTARATVVISLNDDYSQDSVLGFEQISYSGTIVNGAMNLEAIVLNEGFTPQVSFSLLGDLAFLFSLSVDGPKVNIILRGDVPEDLIPPNRIILLELRASAPQALPAFATIVLTVEHENDMPPVEQLTFAETYYLGRYTEQDGLNFDQQFSLARGYDDSVVFALEGDNSIWFGLQRRSENSVGLILTSSIPPAVLANNRKLIFIITATRLGSGTARATVVISLNDDYSQDSVLGFEQISYSGTIVNGAMNLEAIVLNEGFTPLVSFSLLGDLASLFSLSVDGPKVNIILRGDVPEDLIPPNRIILLELRASAPQALPAFATIVLTVKHENDMPPVEQLTFAETYYLGRYTEQDGLNFHQQFSLARGYDDSVVFALEGDNSIWFGLQRRSENSVGLILTSSIPPAVLANNRKLIFIITATRPGSGTARATVVISLNDDYSQDSVLGFEQISYSGTIVNGAMNLEAIVLNEGFTPLVSFSLLGDLASLFSLSVDGPKVNIILRGDVPEDLIPPNRIILLELRASAPQALPAFATIVLTVKHENDMPPVEQLTFAETYYLGRYTEQDGLNFDQHFSLARGYDDSVVFALEGDNSVWFGLQRRSENSVGLILTSSIPPAVLANNRKLIFIITATRLGSGTARATVVISLNDDYSQDSVLGFEQISYSGTIVNGAMNLEAIVLNEGFTPLVSFSLLGDLASLFSLSVDGPKVNIILRGDVPEDLIPPNRIILLELRASAPQALPAFATIVLTVEHENDMPPVEQLTFAETYYLGRYTEQDGLNFHQQFSLARGYDDSVVFALEGDNSIWFGLQRRSENSVGLILTSSIPPAVLANNRKLIFIITATRPGSGTARATVVISLNDDYSQDSVLGFEQISYSGTIVNGAMNLEAIVLNEGFTPLVSFSLLGDLASLFSLSVDGPKVNIILRGDVPEDLIPPNRILLLELRASAPQALPAFATIVLTVKHENEMPPVEQLTFAETYYLGRYTEQDGLNFDQHFSLARGYDDSVVFALEGDNSVWFGLQRRSENSVGLILTSSIPPAVLANNRKLIFIITATRLGSGTARATVVISLNDDYSQDSVLGFEQISYSGAIVNGAINLEAIVLNEGFTPQVSFSLLGDLASLFSLSVDGPKVNIILRGDVPEDLIPPNRILLLELRASAPQALPAFATIVLTVEHDNDIPPVEQLTFAETYYLGRYTEQDGLNFDQQFSLARGYDDSVVFALEGDNSVWFGLQRRSENSVGLILTSSIPPAVLANNRKLIFIITATRLGSGTARATVVISLNDDYSQDSVLGFEQISYSGTIVNGAINLEAIVLNEGFTPQVSFSLLGDLASLFSLSVDGPKVNIILRGDVPEDLIPPNRIILLELRASAPQALPAFATIVLTVEHENDIPPVEQLTFAETYYLGRYTEQDGLNFDQQFSLARGYDDSVVFALEGDNSVWFGLERRSENTVVLTLRNLIPPAVLQENKKLIFIITATRPGSSSARSTVIISLTNDTQADVTFDKILYNGFLRLGTVTHEVITITGYNGSRIEILGQYAELFEANITNQEVTVASKPTSVLPNVSHIALELHAGGARTVLLLTILEPETPALPTVTFDSPSYVLRVDVTHTGLVGRVRATADNGETIVYSLLINDANLQERLSVNSDGELWLSAPARSGAHFLQVLATTDITRVTGKAPVHLVVEAVTVCGDNIVVPPLIILDRDEEEPHRNLVVLNQTAFVGCQFDLSNSWPENQTWLYVDRDGLHAHAIDREHESIAFMALSQIQVELILRCESDTTSRSKRSLKSNPRLDWLGPYEYGSNKWILTDSIPYNARRSLVNLIVNDINDNAPIFVGKENEPIAVGYPIQSLEEIILPRALAQLKATDADIGENAALVYWSEEDSVAVSPSTGFVHVRSHVNLENNTRLIIQATDREGAGLTGSLELVVRLLEKEHIAVLTIRNSFLDDEEFILSELSKTVGYEVKTLRTIVISESEPTRNKRETSEYEEVIGASLQLFVYGLIERQPVEVNQLITDIKNSNVVTVNVASTISLEDHLDGNETCVLPGRDIGLLVATIVLSVLLFILIVAVAVWFLIRKLRSKYEKFSDKNSLASRNESIEQPKPDISSKPRLNIEELRKSEKRLQERLRVPIVDVSDEPTTSEEKPFEAIINISTPEPNLPIVIQTIDKLKDKSEESDDDDEFGEIKKSRRKSVVTFNENVEKIIHLEDNSDNPDSDYEIYRF